MKTMKIDPWIRESNLIEDIDDPTEDMRSQKAWQWFKVQPLTIGNILKLHKKITCKQLVKMDAGHFRKCPVWVGGMEGANWEEVPDFMDQWLRHWKRPLFSKNIESFYKNAHVQFERIHPFVDGNGRTGRMVLQWQRISAGLEPLLIEASKRGDYYRWFR